MSHKASCKIKWCLKDGRKSTVDNWKKKKWYDVHADPTLMKENWRNSNNGTKPSW